ncbi:hypothetical protein AMD01_13775 [Priestia koreensis]|uniref:Uncharacterized protein n=1 Tax=Priestia koreensis TaxID=284581 RepID=A0A0M0KZT6_9BACI|nr:hypothetical protein AMD01_13775 [Priestia koreensis]
MNQKLKMVCRITRLVAVTFIYNDHTYLLDLNLYTRKTKIVLINMEINLDQKKMNGAKKERFKLGMN